MITTERGLVRTQNGYIHYRALGAGPAIMLFHINQQSSAVYLELMSHLAPYFRAVAIDMPSHGMSDHIAEQPTIGDYARAAVAVLDALDIHSCHLLGEAVGAIVATQIAARQPDRVRTMSILNCPYVPGGSTRDTGANVTPKQRPSDSSGFPLTRTLDFLLTHDPVHAPMRPTQDWLDRVNVAQVEAGRSRWQGLQAMHAFDLKSAATAVAHPVLALYGDHFYFTPSRDDLTNLFLDIETAVIPDSRFCLGWERAEEVANKVREFVSRRAPS
jgi:pimeloyl-ACP methyl ester carboxylesterase